MNLSPEIRENAVAPRGAINEFTTEISSTLKLKSVQCQEIPSHLVIGCGVCPH